MKGLSQGDDQIQLLEIQNEELLHRDTELQNQLSRLKRSRTYRLVQALRGGRPEHPNHRLRYYLRIPWRLVQVLSERILGVSPFDVSVEPHVARQFRARRRLARIARSIKDGSALKALEQIKPRPDVVRILVMGVGGVGDVISTTVVIAALKRLLAPCELYLAHTLSQLERLIQENPNVARAWTISHINYFSLQETLTELAIFDLIVDHHYCVRYITTASQRITSRSPPGLLLSAAAATRPFSDMLAWWPERNNMLWRVAQRANLSAFDLAGVTGVLNIEASTPIPFFIVGDDHKVLDVTKFDERRYITVHNGVDSGYQDWIRSSNVQTDSRPTKLLPIETWEEIVAVLKSNGIKTVQLGARNEILINGVDVDLRGRTNLSEAAVILKHAGCHIDTEGGLVHVARAVHCRSVVVFGPTPATFFGYPQNINLSPKDCGDCWWTHPEWLARCPRRTVGPACMASHLSKEIAGEALSIINNFKIADCQLISAQFFKLPNEDADRSPSDLPFVSGNESIRLGPLETWAYFFTIDQIEKSGIRRHGCRIADVGTGPGAVVQALAHQGNSVDVFRDHKLAAPADDMNGESKDSFIAEFGKIGRAQFGSIFNIPANDETYDVVTCTGAIEHIAYREFAIQELLRILKPEGLLFLTVLLVDDARRQHADVRRTMTLDELMEQLSHIRAGTCPLTVDQLQASATEAKQAVIPNLPSGGTLAGIALRKASGSTAARSLTD